MSKPSLIVINNELFNAFQKGDFTVRFNKSVMRNFEDVVGIIKSKSEQIIDCRKPEHFRGEAQEPTPGGAAFTVHI